MFRSVEEAGCKKGRTTPASSDHPYRFSIHLIASWSVPFPKVTLCISQVGVSEKDLAHDPNRHSRSGGICGRMHSRSWRFRLILTSSSAFFRCPFSLSSLKRLACKTFIQPYFLRQQQKVGSETPCFQHSSPMVLVLQSASFKMTMTLSSLNHVPFLRTFLLIFRGF